ncbi:kinetochore Sim4 complex subunit FTA2-domain-containing protein [Lasiosphaeria ovina]|uniref:Kinetochore Sim4 complex subunit FTA2-domain-containing protein n=1 Tax=Lasiosphaeria ovina TaxID=92902 RepID=A0AAE0KLS6_9PEZI|nr:kinetochore Sim4 complex subunit FTA2-domain-containing protein [Lasiosphaeria ovina]
MSGGVKANRKLLACRELPPDDGRSKPGPKLPRFGQKRPSIEWLELLEKSSPESRDACEGYVFKVRIDSKVYALKVFKFFKPSTERHLMTDIEGKDVTDDQLVFHTDPFYAECRAYGRINEAQKKRRPGFARPIAAQCYAFIPLSKRDEQALAERGIDLWGDIPEDDEYRRLAFGSPARAVLKEFIDSEEDEAAGAMDIAMLKTILKNIRALNREGILHRDIRPSNFKAGLLVDFGSAWTQPHCVVDAVPAHVAEDWRCLDLCMFDQMVEDLGFTADDVRGMPNPDYLCKLRSWKP